MSVLIVETDGPVATVTLNRPERRNALTPELLGSLRSTMADLDADAGVRAIVLTGAGPAFCAGLDLEVLADPAGGLLGGEGAGGGDGDRAGQGSAGAGGFWSPTATPVVGAVNGPAVTGGLEIALQCDVRLASPAARFADTHARVGVMPGGGLTWRLPLAVGLSRAIEMSLTGRFVGADEAAAWGLVSRVEADVVAAARQVAAAVAELDPPAASAVLAMYRRAASLGFGAEAATAELEAAATWRRTSFDRAAVEARRTAIIHRGSSHVV